MIRRAARYGAALGLFALPIAIGWLSGMEIARHAYMAITASIGLIASVLYLCFSRPHQQRFKP